MEIYKEEIFKKIKEKIDSVENIMITAHINPDGDAVGASLALTQALIDSGKNARCVFQDSPPDNTHFLENIDLIEKYNENILYRPNLIISLDSATIERIGKLKKVYENCESINIDHHISNTNYGNINYVNPVSSTSEIVYNFLEYAKYKIDKKIGSSLYLGLVNDTGNFRHNNVTKDTFEMAGDLIDIGVDNSYIVREFLSRKSLTAIRLKAHALQNMKYSAIHKLTYYAMTKDVLDMYGARKEDTEGIVEELLALDLAEISLFLREDEIGYIKGSMRSKSVDVNKIAGTFNGGGHKLAAGFSSRMTIRDIIEQVMKEIHYN